MREPSPLIFGFITERRRAEGHDAGGLPDLNRREGASKSDHKTGSSFEAGHAVSRGRVSRIGHVGGETRETGTLKRPRVRFKANVCPEDGALISNCFSPFRIESLLFAELASFLAGVVES